MSLGILHFKRYLMRIALLAIFSVMIFASLSAAAERSLGAVAATNARTQASSQAAANLGAGGPGSDLRAIAGNRQQQPRSFTGLYAAGDSAAAGGGENTNPEGKAVFSGDPLSPPIGPEMIGAKLNRLCVIADHVGYSIVALGYSPTVMDTPYSYALMNGRRRISTLYFDRSMALMAIQ